MPANPTVTNTSCLLALASVARLDLLQQVYGEIWVPQAVADECLAAPLPAWIQVHAVKNLALVQSLRMNLGAGESEAIALALESSAARLILDDRKARQIASQFSMPLTGTVGFIVHCKQRGLLPSARDMLNELRDSGFWISDPLIETAAELAGE